MTTSVATTLSIPSDRRRMFRSPPSSRSPTTPGRSSGPRRPTAVTAGACGRSSGKRSSRPPGARPRRAKLFCPILSDSSSSSSTGRASEPRPTTPPERRPMLPSLPVLLLASAATFLAPPDALIEDLARSASTPPTTTAAPTAMAGEEGGAEEAAPPVAPTAPPFNPRQDALDTYRETGVAPVIYLTNEIVHPWGQTVPTLTCAPLNICSIDLQAGETIQDIAAGDPVRWQIATATSGEPSTPHLIVKPTEFDLATNLFVTTQKRTYSVELR